MDFIEIKSKENIENIALISEAYLLKTHGIQKKIKCIKSDSVYIISCEREIFKLLTDCISESLMLKYSVMFICDIFEEDYGMLSGEEKYDILVFLQEKMNSPDIIDYRKIISNKLQFFSNLYNEINLDGFWIFGIKDIKSTLSKTLEKYANDFLIEEELLEFSYMLKSYIDTEPIGIDELNIVITESGEYKYYDKSKRDITKICLAEFYEEFYESEASDDEILISILIMNLPKKITIYNLTDGKNANLLMMLKNIFGDRLTFCLEKCAFCES